MGYVVKIKHKYYEFILGDLKFTFPMFCQPIVPKRKKCSQSDIG